MISSGFRFMNIPRMECESYQDYLERTYFILNNFKTGKYSYEELIEKSRLYYTMKVLKCVYCEKSMNEIKNMGEYAGV